MFTHFLFNAYRLILIRVYKYYSYFITAIVFKLVGVQYKSFKTIGIPFIHVSLKAKVNIGSNFSLGNSILTSATGEGGRCKIEVRDNGVLTIGNNVGMTKTSIECFNKISIGNDVKIGFGTCIFDTDFHSINSIIRCRTDNDVLTKPVTIEDRVFIGAHCIILKGVTIGEGAIIGAGSVVTKDVCSNSVYAGNPAAFIRKISQVV